MVISDKSSKDIIENFKVHKSKTCYFKNRLAFMLYSKYQFIWSGWVQFMIVNSRMSFSEVEGTHMGNFLQNSWHNNVYYIIYLMARIFRFWGI